MGLYVLVLAAVAAAVVWVVVGRTALAIDRSDVQTCRAVLTAIEMREGSPWRDVLTVARLVHPDQEDRKVWLSHNAVRQLWVVASKRCDPFKVEDPLRHKLDDLFLEERDGSAVTQQDRLELQGRIRAAYTQASQALADAYKQAVEKRYGGTVQFILQGEAILVVDFALDD